MPMPTDECLMPKSRMLYDEREQGSNQSHLLCVGLRSTVPWLIQVRDRGAGGQRRTPWRKDPRGFVSNRPHSLEGGCPGRVQPGSGDRLDLAVKSVDARISVAPHVRQRSRVEPIDLRAHVVEFEHARPLRNQKANRILDRRHRVDEPQSIDRLQQLAVTLERRPWRERDERRRQRQAHLGECRNHRFEVGARMPLLELSKDLIIDRLHGADDECAVGVPEQRQQRALGEEVLDLDGRIVRHVRECRVKALDDRDRVARAVEEVRIAKPDSFSFGINRTSQCSSPLPVAPSCSIDRDHFLGPHSEFSSLRHRRSQHQ